MKYALPLFYAKVWNASEHTGEDEHPRRAFTFPHWQVRLLLWTIRYRHFPK
jgi:hypothetical protein